jgi:hypothetical protein
MKDYFGRELEVGDTIIWVKYTLKRFSKSKVLSFGKQFGKVYAQTDGGRVQSEFIILEKVNGEKLTWC